MSEEKKQLNMKVDETKEIGSDTIQNGSGIGRIGTIERPMAYKMVPEVRKEKEWESTKAHKKLFLVAWEQTLGSVKATAERAGIDRNTYYLWLQNDPEFAAAIRDYNRKKLEDVEQLASLEMLKGNSSLIRHYLDRRHPDYKPSSVTEVITSGKSFKQLIDDENERRNNEKTESVESGSNPNDAENKEQARENGVVQTESGANVLLDKENEAKSDIESEAKGNQ